MGFEYYYSTPYYTESDGNALFTFKNTSVYTVDQETGNYIPSSSNIVLIRASLHQSSDPNITNQPGVDYNRIYFEGRLIPPDNHPLVYNGKNVTAIINGRAGTFDFVPVYESEQAQNINAIAVIGKAIAGYFLASR